MAKHRGQATGLWRDRQRITDCAGVDLEWLERQVRPGESWAPRIELSGGVGLQHQHSREQGSLRPATGTLSSLGEPWLWQAGQSQLETLELQTPNCALSPAHLTGMRNSCPNLKPPPSEKPSLPPAC